MAGATINWRIESFDELPSTMNLVHDRAKNGAEEGLVITAKQQIAGRGRGNNIWLAPAGNLSCSILLRPQISQKQAGQFSFLTAVALAKTIAPLLAPAHTLSQKWPNDVLINGIKCAGILLESDATTGGNIEYLNIGVGVNIEHAPDDKIAVNQVAKTPIKVNEFLDLLLNNLSNLLAIYNEKGFELIRAEWLSRAHNVNKIITVRLPHETCDGIFTGITADGALELTTDENKIRLIHSGDVFFK